MEQKTIFIVDDFDTSLAETASALQTDYNLLTMTSAKMMFKLLEKIKPDLILLDVEMPEVNGFDVLAEMKAHPEWKAIPVIFLTSWFDQGLAVDALSLGAADVINKPVNPSKLQTRVKQCIR